MDAAVAAGFTVMRAWTHGVTPNYALQTSPGVYNEAMFRGLDYALDEARQHGIKVSSTLLSPSQYPAYHILQNQSPRQAHKTQLYTMHSASPLG